MKRTRLYTCPFVARLRHEDILVKKREMLPVIPLKGMAVLPGTVIHFELNQKNTLKGVEQALTKKAKVFLVTERSDSDTPYYSVGNIAVVRQLSRMQNDTVRLLVSTLERGILTKTTEKDDVLYGLVEPVDFADEEENQLEPEEDLWVRAMLKQLKETFESYIKTNPNSNKNGMKRYNQIEDLGLLLDQIAMNLPIDVQKKQMVLETFDLEERVELVLGLLRDEIEITQIRSDISQKVRGKIEQSQKEYFLREQMNFIREELGEDALSEADQYEEDLLTLEASDEVKEKIQKEINRFKNLSKSSSESAVERAYIETLLELPWDKMSVDNSGLGNAEYVLNRDHYGLEKVKDRILEFLAVRNLTDKGDSPIICLVGPPGTGKTSIARSVAEALNKKYVRICLGGVRDEAEIRGHRKTYVGAMPGRLAAGLKAAGVKNPLMLLDEIDKVGTDHRGDTASALLEVLDPDQNNRFRDHYIEIPMDLSEVLFIATANNASDIPRPLLDRMELIEVSSYTENEKFHIAKEHLVKKQLEKNGLTASMLHISDSALKAIISSYTKEAGVRGLERTIAKVCRKAAKKILFERENQEEVGKIRVNSKNLEEFLGKPKYRKEEANKKPEIGIVRGLAWTSVGGDTLQIEVNKATGKGDLRLTGQMGDVMKESALIALSYVRSVVDETKLDKRNLSQEEEKIPYFKRTDFHLHIPAGAIPKDGPSAGITMATALYSVVCDIPVRADLAMTGEITLRGKVLPIGGLKEKLLAAKMAGIKEVLVPFDNQKDVDEIDDEIKEGLLITYVKSMKEVLSAALLKG